MEWLKFTGRNNSTRQSTDICDDTQKCKKPRSLDCKVAQFSTLYRCSSSTRFLANIQIVHLIIVIKNFDSKRCQHLKSIILFLHGFPRHGGEQPRMSWECEKKNRTNKNKCWTVELNALGSICMLNRENITLEDQWIVILMFRLYGNLQQASGYVFIQYTRYHGRLGDISKRSQKTIASLLISYEIILHSFANNCMHSQIQYFTHESRAWISTLIFNWSYSVDLIEKKISRVKCRKEKSILQEPIRRNKNMR